MNICMVGYGMMGTWHSRALRHGKDTLHTLVGHDLAKAAKFAQEFGYACVSDDYQQAFSNPEIDVVIIAGPSQSHAEMALYALSQGKHVLVEIPLALTLADCERIVEAAERYQLTVGVVHPMRFRKEHIALTERLNSGEEILLQVQSRLYLHRRENIGSTGLQRSWTDNLLWHHGAHLVDVGLWLAGAGEPQRAADKLIKISSVMPAADNYTTIPMELTAILETSSKQAISCMGSYNSPDRIFDVFVITNQNSYRLDILSGQLYLGAEMISVDAEETNNAQVAPDFLNAIREKREPRVTVRSVLPAMRILDAIERQQQNT
ncbi:Gfo/Idh/MocA family protein [Pantoea cypripedii]|uniref:Gfo/Idh/MocA family oxidoreductase n=1 Tax=Pantoea cypripedii TaxID=55209 RepID=A0A6B9G661_PANCY|nr:Gfo/Idh/MocA family oxidoreductase [Pantoea cypripedii]QGY33054.1 gfo/Idh/MocA family oxidoreductase [Pantoea cypripedii]